MKTFIIINILLISIILNHPTLGNSGIKSHKDLVFATSKLPGEDPDVIILNEENIISFDGDNPDLIYFSVTKKVKYRINTQEGIDKISEFILPETFDPTYIPHFPPKRNYTHVFSRMKCDYFRAEITSKNGNMKEARVKHSVDEFQMLMLEEKYYGKYNKFNYEIENLEIGDELSVEYGYSMPYDENLFKLSSFRIFFNSDIFKEQYKLSIQFDTKLPVDFNFYNNAEPDSIIEVGYKKKYYWTRDNLYGCILEKGSRPYLSLPYIIFTPRPYTMLYTLPHSFEERLTPFYSLLTRIREQNHFGIAISIAQGVNTRQYNQIESFVANEIKGIENDTIGYDQLSKIHNTIVDEFEFADDLDYFTRVDRRDQRIGDYISQRQVRDIGRYELYLALILSLDLNYYTTYLCDIRSGLIGDDYFAPMYYSDYIYTVLLKDDNTVFLYPKKSRFGYYLNELPFYFQNARARLVRLGDYQNIEVPIQEEFRETYIPLTKSGYNIRSSRIKVDINLDELSATFNAQIKLSGQFSTMTRGAYQYNYHDETTNDLYGVKVWEFNDEVNIVRNIVEVEKKEPPFTTKISAKYQADNILTVSNDTVILNTSDWFKHIIYEDFDISERQLDFYPDFASRDTYGYYIEFDQDIKLIDSFEKVEISSESASLIINIEQVTSKIIKMESYFAISNKIEADKIEIIKDIYNKIEELNNSQIKLILE